MAVLTVAERVLETVSAITGTGTYTLAGAVSGYQSFSAIGNANNCWYYAEAVDANGVPNGTSTTSWEVGIGTYTSSGTTLARTTVLASSNSNNAVSWSAQNLRISAFGIPPAAIAPYPYVETAMTADTTLTATAYGKSYLVTITSAGITATLPAAAGHAGETIKFRLAGSCTKLCTLDGNASETIDGALTRIMWAGESCEIMSDGTNWTKRAGLTIPMQCVMRRNAAVSLANGGPTKILLDTTDLDNTGLMGDAATNHYITIKRTGNYQFNFGTGLQTVSNAASTGEIQAMYVNKNAGTVIAFGETPITISTSSSWMINASAVRAVAAGDTIQLDIYQNSGGSQTLDVGAITGPTSLLEAIEQPTW